MFARMAVFRNAIASFGNLVILSLICNDLLQKNNVIIDVVV